MSDEYLTPALYHQRYSAILSTPAPAPAPRHPSSSSVSASRSPEGEGSPMSELDDQPFPGQPTAPGRRGQEGSLNGGSGGGAGGGGAGGAGAGVGAGAGEPKKRGRPKGSLNTPKLNPDGSPFSKPVKRKSIKMEEGEAGSSSGAGDGTGNGNGNGTGGGNAEAEEGKLGTGEAGKVVKKSKKARIALSCAQCTKRKQKCDRQTPCNHCLSRKCPDLCIPYIPGMQIPTLSNPHPSSQTSTPTAIASASPAASASTPIPAAASVAAQKGKGKGVEISPAPAPAAAAVGEAGMQSPAAGYARPVGQAGAQIGARVPQQVLVGRGYVGGTLIAPRPMPATGTGVRVGNGTTPTPAYGANVDASSSAGGSRMDAPRMDLTYPRQGQVVGLGPGGMYASNLEFQAALTRLDRVEDHLGLPVVMDGLIAPQPMRRPSSGLVEEGGGIPGGQERAGGEAFSRSTSAGDGVVGVDAGKWFATETSVPNIETLRGRNTTINLNLADCGTPSENLQRLIKECGVSPLKLLELVQELPPYEFALQLVNYFFSHVNFVRYPIHEEGFRLAFEDMYRRKNGRAEPEPGNVRSLPLIFIVLATASRLAPEEWAGDDRERRLNSLRMYWCSRRSILIATAVQPESLELVVTRLLSGLYLVLIHDRRLTECWSQLGASLRTAQAIGLHRDGTKLGLDPFQTEYRRRVWSYLYHADRNYSLILGRPPSIVDAYCDAKDPSNIELSDIILGQPIVSKPLSEPTSATFIILRKRFSIITGKITHHFQKLNEPAKFEDVVALDKELRDFIDELPPHYRMAEADKSLDDTLPFLPLHRTYLSTEILFIIITLHRPWLLRKLKSDRFSMSRNACFEAAKMDFRVRQAFRREHPEVHNAYFGGQFREFNAAMIAGISAIIFPRAPDAVEMRAILQTFLDPKVNRNDRKNKDQTSMKEIAIIQTLNRRALQVLETEELPEARGHPVESVSLLLGLRKGDNGKKPVTPGIHMGHGGPFLDSAYSGGHSTITHVNRFYDVFVPRDGAEQEARTNTNTQAQAAFERVQAAPFQPLSLTVHANQNGNGNGQSSGQSNPPGSANVAGSVTGASDGKGVEQSSPSTVGHEDAPQRLLDQWLSANNSLVGNLDGSLDEMFPLNPDLSFPGQYAPAPLPLSTPSYHPEYPTSQTPAQAAPQPWTPNYANQGPFPSAGFGRSSGNGFVTMGGGFTPTGTGGEFGGGMGAMGMGMGMGMGGVAEGLEGLGEGGFPLDDTYWNNLIDGILNST